MTSLKIIRACNTPDETLNQGAALIRDIAEIFEKPATLVRTYPNFEVHLEYGDHKLNHSAANDDNVIVTLESKLIDFHISVSSPCYCTPGSPAHPVIFPPQKAKNQALDLLYRIADMLEHAAQAENCLSGQPGVDLRKAIEHRLDAIGCHLGNTIEDIDLNAGMRVSAPSPFSPLDAQSMFDGEANGHGRWDVIPLAKDMQTLWWHDLPVTTMMQLILPMPQDPQDEQHPPKGRWSMHFDHLMVDWRGSDDPIENLRLLSQLPKADR